MLKTGAIYQTISCFCFALLGFQIKQLLVISNIESIVFFRSSFGLLIVFILLLIKKNFFKNFYSQNFRIHLLRSLFGVLAMYFGYNSLNYISLSQATTIGFTKVFFTSLVAVVLFKEKLDLKKIVLILIGFLGVVLIAQPGQVTQYTGIFMSLFSALCVSGGILTISFLTKKDDVLKIIFFHSFFSSFIFLFIFWETINFYMIDNYFRFFIATLTALLGQYCNAISLKLEETSKVVIVGYLRIIFATFLGYFFLNELLNFEMIVGIILVIFSSLIISKN